MSLVIYICGLLGITACCFTCLMGFIRLVQAFANEGLLPQIFTEVSERTGIPVKASVILTVLLMPLAFFESLEQISKLISLSQLLIYSFVSVCSLHVRFSRKVDVFTDVTYRSSEPDIINHQTGKKRWYRSGQVVTFIYTISAFVSACILHKETLGLEWILPSHAVTVVLFVALCLCR